MAKVLESSSYAELLQSAAGLLLSMGRQVSPRSVATRECQHVAFILNSPMMRYPRVPGRNANIFALLAETLWVLQGKDDLEFIMPYLPRMSSYADDGITLSGAYGPRLRNWHGVDQLRSIVSTLENDCSSRRAVISLFDPEVHQNQQSLDIPCCNMLQFTVEDRRLNLAVFSRSMDIMWGSAINFFEWTTLQEAVAYWLGLRLGVYTHFVGSLHIYDEFIGRAERFISASLPTTLPITPFDVPLREFDAVLKELLLAESGYRSGDYSAQPAFPTSCWANEVQMLLKAYWFAKNSGEFNRAISLVNEMETTEATSLALDQLMYMKKNSKNV